MFKYFLFCLVIVQSIECRVFKEYPLTSDGLEIDMDVKSKDKELYKIQISVDEQNKTVRLIRSQPLTPAVVGATGTAKPNVTVDERFGITGAGGNCPSGYVRRGGFCFPDDDY